MKFETFTYVACWAIWMFIFLVRTESSSTDIDDRHRIAGREWGPDTFCIRVKIYNLIIFLTDELIYFFSVVF